MKMAKEGKRSESPEFFAKGGSGKMFGKGHASDAPSGVSGKESQEKNDGAKPDENEAEGYGSGFRFAEGGDGTMFGKGHAGKKVPGISGKATQEG
jgi:hypothetical protein